ncbi:DNA cytosine methyltransferase [Hymenobacter sp. AT01-02]|uniref:DNA cytosine methyltransferase n=1 Tax=Hymenobacter sp. AT01-02 TaxID=1571877 RepID=UPI0009EA617C|nr:DNA cytosine methyltransferase [Hymenobacter sp. AT01-02]
MLDLFSGCGGLSLGFHRAGFTIAGAVEVDPHAALTHARNFHNRSPEEMEVHGRSRDITKVDPGDLLEELGIRGPIDEAVDIIVGGPPCQAYTRIGRAKLRALAEHPEAYLQDTRGNLYLRYLEYVALFKPLALVMENVPDALNYGGINVAEETCEELKGFGYTCQYTLLNSAFYGVPQMRERMVLIAYRTELGVEVTFPEATHSIQLPRGYLSARNAALKHVRVDLFSRHYVEVGRDNPALPPAVTAQDALCDLPKITEHLRGKMKRGTKRLDAICPYNPGVEPGAYGTMMREWGGFESTAGVDAHVIRSLPRDYKIFQRMAAGDQYPQAHMYANQMFQEELKRRYKRPLPVDSARYKKLHKEYVPPYDPEKFPNKWRKMEPDQPARTLMAHLGKDSYSHIHYDSAQARTISVREAARLQSFPDGFGFCGTMNPAFKQIGNAVPPLLSYAVASTISTTLDGARAAVTQDCAQVPQTL